MLAFQFALKFLYSAEPGLLHSLSDLLMVITTEQSHAFDWQLNAPHIHLDIIASYSSCVPNLTAMTACKNARTNERIIAAMPIPGMPRQ